MAEPLDLIVIGTGTGGSGPTYRCRRAGWRVAVVDELPYGGTCALRGCDPKKVLVGAAELADWRRRMQGRGVSGDAHISWPELMQFKRTFTDPVPADREKAFQDAGIASYHGPARFVSPERLSVDGQRSEEHTSELQSRLHLVCRLLLEKKKKQPEQLHDRITTDVHTHA